MRDELERMWKEALSWYLQGGTIKNKEECRPKLELGTFHRKALQSYLCNSSYFLRYSIAVSKTNESSWEQLQHFQNEFVNRRFRHSFYWHIQRNRITGHSCHRLAKLLIYTDPLTQHMTYCYLYFGYDRCAEKEPHPKRGWRIIWNKVTPTRFCIHPYFDQMSENQFTVSPYSYNPLGSSCPNTDFPSILV
jgi:hypothetical protein